MDCFISYYGFYHTRVVMGMLKPSMSKSEKVMVVSSRGSLDIVCTSMVSPDLMLCRWAFLAELDSPPPANPPEITWIYSKGG